MGDRVTAATTRALWSAELGPERAGQLAVDRYGGCLVLAKESLAYYPPDGRLGWRVSLLGNAYELPVLAPDGAIRQIEGGHVVTREPATGQVVSSFAAPRATALTADPWGGLVYREGNPNGPGRLRCVTTAGEERWANQLHGRMELGVRPVPVGDAVVVGYGGLLRALDSNGGVRWLAGHAGFRETGPDGVEPEQADEVWTLPRQVTDTTLLVGLRWSAGANLFLVDTAERTVRRYVDGMAPKAPTAVVLPPEGGFRVAFQGPPREVRQMEWHWSVVMLDPAGAKLWEHRLPAAPNQFLPGRAGTLVVAGTPSLDRWDKYSAWQDLSKEVYVGSLAPDGAERWTWHGSGPLTHLPAVRPDGVVYVGSAGRLWALADEQ
jgi:hypothetical protein